MISPGLQTQGYLLLGQNAQVLRLLFFLPPFPRARKVAALDAVTAEATKKAAVRRDRAKFLQRRRCVRPLLVSSCCC